MQGNESSGEEDTVALLKLEANNGSGGAKRKKESEVCVSIGGVMWIFTEHSDDTPTAKANALIRFIPVSECDGIAVA